MLTHSSRDSSRGFAGSLLLGCLLFSGCTEGSAYEWIVLSNAHRDDAETAVRQGDAERATTQLEHIIGADVPSDVALEDARIVHQDAYDLLARLALDRVTSEDATDEALAWTNAGLALEGDDIFVANLLITRGRALEASSRDREAASDYHRAQEILEVALEAALRGEGM